MPVSPPHDGVEMSETVTMFGIGDKLKSAAAAGGVLVLTGAIAVLGLVWLSIAAYTLLAEVFTPAASMAIVGGVALVPGLVVLIRKWPQAKPEPEPHTAVDPDASALVRLAQGATLLAEKSPVLGAALTLGAAFVASRSPVTSALAVHMLAEAVDRWTKPSTPPETEAPPVNSGAHVDRREARDV